MKREAEKMASGWSCEELKTRLGISTSAFPAETRLQLLAGQARKATGDANMLHLLKENRLPDCFGPAEIAQVKAAGIPKVGYALDWTDHKM